MALMSGAGGNHVMMLPSGLTVIRFMYADDHEVSQTVPAVEGYSSSSGPFSIRTGR